MTLTQYTLPDTIYILVAIKPTAKDRGKMEDGKGKDHGKMNTQSLMSPLPLV